MGEEEGQGGVSRARQALERGDFAEARRLAGEDPEVAAYVRPDRVAIIVTALSFLLFVPIAVYYLGIR